MSANVEPTIRECPACGHPAILRCAKCDGSLAERIEQVCGKMGYEVVELVEYLEWYDRRCREEREATTLWH